jgi:bifunctional non-homologous end joining protein LigD
VIARKLALESMLNQRSDDCVRFCGSLEGKPSQIWNAINRQGLEGIIAKRRDSVYEAGQRSGAWVKIKTQVSQEFVIGGYSLPEGSRKYFGSLVVGYYENGALKFASRVGTGFDFKTLKSLYALFQPLRIESSPFIDLPVRREQRYGQGLTRAEMARCVWLRPKLVCQVKFMEWTRHLQLRMPVFLGLRADKKATEVVRETGSSRRQETHTSRPPATSDPVRVSLPGLLLEIKRR